MNSVNDMTGECRPANGNRRPGSPPKMRVASFEDYDQIAALQNRYGLATRSHEDWMEIWRGNPVYKQRGGQCPIGWVLESEDGEIVGWIGNIPLAYRFRGRELRAATSCGWVVDARYRGYSMLLMASFIRQKDVDLLICTTVSSVAEPIFRCGAFQLSKVPVGAWDKLAFDPIYRGIRKAL